MPFPVIQSGGGILGALEVEGGANPMEIVTDEP
jgi:hypothetical protein